MGERKEGDRRLGEMMKDKKKEAHSNHKWLSYAIIAFNQAAAICLDFYSKPQPHFAALVCYYPTYLPNPKVS